MYGLSLFSRRSGRFTRAGLLRSMPWWIELSSNPNEDAPKRIQIWGTFAVEKLPYSSTYSDPEKGYLY